MGPHDRRSALQRTNLLAIAPLERGMALGASPLQLVIDEPVDGVVRLQLCGELDMLTAGEVVATLHAARGALPRVRLDLRRLDFVDSVGLTLLLNLRLDAHDEGWALELVRPRAHVWRVVEAAGLADLLPWLPATSPPAAAAS